MKNRDELIIALFPSSVLVDGIEKDAIYDLQRQRYHLIPHSLYHILISHKNDTIGCIKELYKGNEEYIDQYVDFLLENDYCILCHKEDNIFIPICNKYFSPKLITNALFDYDKHSCYSLQDAILQLDKLRCENLELRFYDSITIAQLAVVLSYANETTLRDIEVLVQYAMEFDLDSIINLRMQYPRMRKITIVNAPPEKENIYDHEELYIIFSSENVVDETSCGVVNPWYMLPKTELYLESLNYNTCLNGKISIDKRGNIKNCPSMYNSWGKFGSVTLMEVVNNNKFQELWHIKKDDIKICKQCELRHMCQDCRAYITNPNDIYSKPLKCKYNY